MKRRKKRKEEEDEEGEESRSKVSRIDIALNEQVPRGGHQMRHHRHSLHHFLQCQSMTFHPQE